MQYVGRVFSTVSQYYKEINPATLSGAIDIVVVQHENGDLACSPFHVRFGKLSVLRPTEKKVEISVNGQKVDFPMKVGDAGEAFFVFETDQQVPEELQTSPIAGPSEGSDVAEEPDFLDLSATPRKDEGMEDGYVSADSDHLSSPNKPPGASNLAITPSDTPKKAISNSIAQETSPSTILNQSVVASPGALLEQGNAFPFSQSDKAKQEQKLTQDAELGVKPAHEDKVEEGPTETNVKANNGDVLLDVHGYKADETNIKLVQEQQERMFKESAAGQPMSTGDLGDKNLQAALDKMTLNNLERHSQYITLESLRKHLEKKHKQPNEMRERLHDQIEEQQDQYDQTSYDADKETSLSDTEIDAPRRPDKLKQRKSHGGYTSDGDIEEDEPEPSSEWSWGWGGFPSKEKTEKSGKGSEADAENADALNDLSGYCELSLCGPAAFKDGEIFDEEIFAEKAITIDTISKKPTVLDSDDLVIRYNNRYFAWSKFAPVLSSILAAQKSPSPEVLDSLAYSELSASVNDKKSSSRRGWSRWWRRTSSRDVPSSDLESQKTAKEDGSLSPTTTLAPSVEETAPEPKTAGKNFAKTLRLTSDQLKQLKLTPGVNTITFTVISSYQGVATCAAKIFCWSEDQHVVISDIDGTITKSDALGHVFTMIGRDWTHSGVAKLYTDIRNNGYQILYLTSRAIGQADYTRDYLKKVEQNKYQLPDGPVIMSPDRLITALHREVIMRKPEVFKMACLRDVQRLFGERNPFYAGFGNRITDALSYRSVNVPSSRIFTIDSNGEVKMELLELAGYKSSYIHMTDLVDHFFPPVGKKSGEPEYNDFNFWKDPLPNVDIPIPSPPTSPLIRPDSRGSRTSMIRSFAGSFANRSRSGTGSSTAPVMMEPNHSRSLPDLPHLPSSVESDNMSIRSAPRELEHERRRTTSLYDGNGNMDIAEDDRGMDDKDEDYVSPGDGSPDEDEGDDGFDEDRALEDEDDIGDPADMDLEEFAEQDPLARSLDLKSTPYL